MKSTVSVKCGADGCNEHRHYEADNKKEASRLYTKYGNGRYRCARHTNEEQVMGINNIQRETVLTAEESKKYPELKELFWGGSQGFISGPGFKAYSNDMPKGTKIIITAKLVLP